MINETLSWLEHNGNADKETYDERQKQIEGVAIPIMQKLYSQGGSAKASEASEKPDVSSRGPTIEQVD